jgi:hypothetical protein
VSSAAHVVRVSAERLDQIDDRNLLPQVSEPLAKAKIQLNGVTGALDAAADAAALAPGMLGVDVPRNYLLIVQNNAESRASGGIPGALAVLTLDKGKLTLGAQSSASQVGIMDPVLPIDSEQAAIYTGRLGKFMQDTNLTPDFPTAASLAQAMWERKTGQRVDGVISLDPVALGFILDATGPVQLSNPELLKIASLGLPTELRGDNVVQTLLSDVYAKIDEPKLQDAYFAGVAQQIFSALSNGQSHAKSLIEGITHGVQEGRVLAWSGSADEQNILAKYLVSGSTTGPSVSPAQFGVYFNDGTGAKMDYYVPADRPTHQRNARRMATRRLPFVLLVPIRHRQTMQLPCLAYVTGDGIYGVPPGQYRPTSWRTGLSRPIWRRPSLTGRRPVRTLHAQQPTSRRFGRPVGAR